MQLAKPLCCNLGWSGVPEFTLLCLPRSQLIIQKVSLLLENFDRSNDSGINFEMFFPDLLDIYSSEIGEFWDELRDLLGASSIEILII